jgi:hypothetical protein
MRVFEVMPDLVGCLMWVGLVGMSRASALRIACASVRATTLLCLVRDLLCKQSSFAQRGAMGRSIAFERLIVGVARLSTDVCFASVADAWSKHTRTFTGGMHLLCVYM